jgi:hypothetical protein
MESQYGDSGLEGFQFAEYLSSNEFFRRRSSLVTDGCIAYFFVPGV